MLLYTSTIYSTVDLPVVPRRAGSGFFFFGGVISTEVLSHFSDDDSSSNNSSHRNKNTATKQSTRNVYYSAWTWQQNAKTSCFCHPSQFHFVRDFLQNLPLARSPWYCACHEKCALPFWSHFFDISFLFCSPLSLSIPFLSFCEVLWLGSFPTKLILASWTAFDTCQCGCANLIELLICGWCNWCIRFCRRRELLCQELFTGPSPRGSRRRRVEKSRYP